MTIISLLLLVSLLPGLNFTARVNVGIVNGREAKPHSRPYMVSLQKDKRHKCGGFLISDKFVMTAAHCRNKSEVLTVVLGAHDLRKQNENSVRYRVDSYHQHPKYTRESLHNDIMLLKLEKEVELNNNIKWISMPKKKGKGDVKAGSVCSITGWGSLETNGNTSDELMETNVKVMNNKICESKWGKEQFSTLQMMCVHGVGGSCHGDSGGPLVCEHTAVGVTSFVDRDLCNSPKGPGVYTKISAYLTWIKNIIGEVN